MGEALRRTARSCRVRGTAAARWLIAALALVIGTVSPAAAQPGRIDAPLRLEHGRFTVVAWKSEETLARALLASAVLNDTFPGLPRARDHVLIAVAPDRERFREWIGESVPEWGAAVAFPGLSRIVMQGRSAGAEAGDPITVLRHELAHLALNEYLDGKPPRWFDEGYASYAAGEWGRDQVLATNVALVWRGVPGFAALDSGFREGATRAAASYALAHRAVAELAALDSERGLSLFFRYWRESGSMERAVRQAYQMSLDGFEEHWQSRTSRRFGALALLADLSLATGGIVILLVPLYMIRRRRDRGRLAAMVAADLAAERAARESAIEELLHGAALPPYPPGGSGGS
jgi:hypothetical protein